MADGDVLVAGGTGALGAAVVRDLLDSGRRVWATWIADKERARMEEAPGLTLVRADLFDPVEAAAAVDAVEDLGAVVDLVGGFAAGPLVHEAEPEEFDRMLRLNLRPAVLLARAAMPRLVERGGGTFVGVSARTAERPFRGSAPYATAKAAVLAFIRALDADYRDAGVRANAIVPSVIDTPANRASQPDADHDRWPSPAELAGVVRFLSSADSAPTSGAAIPVYGRA